MKKKIVWLVVTSLLVLALLAAACGGEEKEEAAAPGIKVTEEKPAAEKPAAEKPAAKEEAAPAVKEAAPVAGAETVKVTLTRLDGTTMEKVVEKPKYGGVLSFVLNANILAWDEAVQAPWTLSTTLGPTHNDLVMGDWARGLAGTGEYTWYLTDWFGLASVTGELAESWEFPDDTTVIFHIRKGVHWQNKPPVNGREFTADDVVFNIKRIYFDLKSATMYGMLGASRPTDVYATDKYTVVVKVPKGHLGVAFQNIGDLTKMFPPEVIEQYGDHNQWENVVGTGPFLLTDYVPMSSATYQRNPDYWEYDPVLGEEYPLPYLDGIKMLIITDISTRLAATRSGKIDIDWYLWYGLEDMEQVKQFNPNVRFIRIPPALCAYAAFRVDKPELPYDDLRVRRALLMGINQQEIADTYYKGDAAILNYKIMCATEYQDLGWYTPLEELPESSRELYEYHPDKARQLLAEAGYPDGFKAEVVVNALSVPYLDQMQMAKQYWTKIGVDLSIDVKEYGSYMSIYQKKTHNEGLTCGRGGFADSMYTVRKGNMYNIAMVDDPKIDEFYEKISAAFFDQPTKNQLMREMNQYVISQTWYYSWPSAYNYRMYQPWVKNYSGEWGPGVYSVNWHRYVWYDQELKKEMGY